MNEQEKLKEKLYKFCETIYDLIDEEVTIVPSDDEISYMDAASNGFIFEIGSDIDDIDKPMNYKIGKLICNITKEINSFCKPTMLHISEYLKFRDKGVDIGSKSDNYFYIDKNNLKLAFRVYYDLIMKRNCISIRYCAK